VELAGPQLRSMIQLAMAGIVAVLVPLVLGLRLEARYPQAAVQQQAELAQLAETLQPSLIAEPPFIQQLAGLGRLLVAALAARADITAAQALVAVVWVHQVQQKQLVALVEKAAQSLQRQQLAPELVAQAAQYTATVETVLTQ
jgi:hypothetical protein